MSTSEDRERLDESDATRSLDAVPARRAWIGLGSNVGDRAAHIAAALAAIDALPGVELEATSSVHETEPVGPSGQGPYLNAVCRVVTTRTASGLLADLLAIERTRGRDRGTDAVRWGPRTLDLDLLLVGPNERSARDPILPHPRLHERVFVLAPLAELDPDLVVPATDRSVAAMLADLAGC